ncbi:MAG: signal peptidase I [Candidatus Omnitrophota bacterium]|nr:signal peptidase I [Candidatus Omnitrophota bacterium]
MHNIELIRQAIATRDKVNLLFNGKSMYPTLKDSMMLTISNIPAQAIKIADIIVYKQDTTIVAHRVIDLIRNNGKILFVTKGDNQPLGGLNQISQANLIGRVEAAFYKDSPPKNILNKNKGYDLLYVFLGRAFLFFQKFKRYIPNFIITYLKYSVRGFYFALGNLFK